MDQPLDYSISEEHKSAQEVNTRHHNNEFNTNAVDTIDIPAHVEVYKRLTHELSYAEARELLNDPKDQPILTQVPLGPLKMNTVYLYDTSKSNHAYWNIDGKSWNWKRVRKEPMRSDNKIVCQRQYKLRHNGVEVQSFRDEMWEVNGDPKFPSTWNPPRVIVFYRGSFEVNEAINTPHGNFGKPKSVKKLFNPCTSKSMQIKANSQFLPVGNTVGEVPEICSEGFQATPKATMETIDDKLKQNKTPATIQREMNMAEVYDDSDTITGPRDKKQIQNRSQKLKDQMPNNDLADLYAFAIDHGDIIRKMELIPGLLVVARHPELESHFLDLYSVSPYMFFYYDTTFNLGKRFVSVLSARHPGLTKNPVYPLSLLYHEYTDKKFTHAPFLQSVANDLCKLNTAKTVICTDREASIKAAVAQILPNATHIFCYIHMLKNVNRWVVRNFKKEDRKYYYSDVKKLLWCESILEYESLLESFCEDDNGTDHEDFDGIDEIGNIRAVDEELDLEADALAIEANSDHVTCQRKWNTRFVTYYKTYLDSDIRKSFRGAVTKFGIFNVHSGITSNPAESINAQLQNSVAEQKNPYLYSLVNNVYDFQTSQLLEIKKGLWDGKGNYRLDVDFIKKRDKLNYVVVKNARIVRDCGQPEINERRIPTREDKDCNFQQKKTEAQEIVHLKNALFLRNGYWVVFDKFEIPRLVNFPKQECTCAGKTRCVHNLAVKIAIGVEGNPNFVNLNFVEPKTLTQLYENQASAKVGKKRGGNRVPVVYEQCQEGETDEDEINGHQPDATDDNRKPMALHEIQIEPVKLPMATGSNHMDTLISWGVYSLTLKDLKSLEDNISSEETKLLSTKVLVANKVRKQAFRKYWLTDAVIDSYLAKICANGNVKAVRAVEVSVILSGSETSSGIARHLHRGDTTQILELLLPFNVGGNHWCLLIAHMREKKIVYYDPLNTRSNLQRANKVCVSRFLNELQGLDRKAFWTLEKADVLKQHDGDNCGLYVLAMATSVVNLEQPLQSLNLIQFRKLVLKKIVGECNVISPMLDRNSVCGECKTDNKKNVTTSAGVSCIQCGSWYHKNCLLRRGVQLQVKGTGFMCP